jgi:hypothetical protein
MNEDQELLLYRIFCGYLIFYVNNEKYILKSANLELKYESQILYSNIINDEKYNDWLREENLENLLVYLNLWTKDSKMIIKDLEKKIDNSKADYYSNFKFSDKKKTVKKNLENYKKQLNNILIKKEDLYSNTLEGYANSLKNEFIITHTLYKNNNLAFDQNKGKNDYVLFNNIVNELNKYTINIFDFKKLARSNLWRSYWNVKKSNVFDNNNLTDDQRTLVGISQMYDRVYEHPECPEDEIIEDDDALDGWMIVQKKKIEKDKKQQQIDSLNPKLKNAQEVFLFANNKEEAQEIVGLNSPESLNRMKSKMAHVSKFGLTEESQLPDVQIDLRNQLNQQNKNRK